MHCYGDGARPSPTWRMLTTPVNTQLLSTHLLLTLDAIFQLTFPIRPYVRMPMLIAVGWVWSFNLGCALCCSFHQ